MILLLNRLLMIQKKIFIFTFVIVYFFVAPFLVSAQETSCPESQNKKAVKIFRDASDLFKQRKYSEVKPLIEKAIDEDPEFADAYLLQGNAALKKHEDKVMEQSFLKVIELCPDLNAEIYYQLGWYYFDTKKYKDAPTRPLPTWWLR